MKLEAFLKKVYSQNIKKLSSYDKYTYSLITIKCPIYFYYKYVKELDYKNEFMQKGINYHSAISKTIKGERLNQAEREFAFDVYLTKQALKTTFNLNFVADNIFSEVKLQAKVGKYNIYGIIDLFYFVEDVVNVIDFKYAYNSPFYKKGYKLQGLLYSYLLLDNFKEKINYIEFYNYYKFSNEFVKLFTFSKQQENDIKIYIVKSIEDFRSLVLDFDNYKNYKNFSCESCIFKFICEVYNEFNKQE